jgi:hypothetical protein
MRTVDGHQTDVLDAVLSPSETELATLDVSGPILLGNIPSQPQKH